MHFIKHLLGKNKREIVFRQKSFKYWSLSTGNIEIGKEEVMCWQCLECGKITKIKEVK